MRSKKEEMAEKDESLLLFREWLDKQFMGLLRLY
jgi:hypothetical protein